MVDWKVVLWAAMKVAWMGEPMVGHLVEPSVYSSVEYSAVHWADYLVQLLAVKTDEQTVVRMAAKTVVLKVVHLVVNLAE